MVKGWEQLKKPTKAATTQKFYNLPKTNSNSPSTSRNRRIGGTAVLLPEPTIDIVNPYREFMWISLFLVVPCFLGKGNFPNKGSRLPHCKHNRRRTSLATRIEKCQNMDQYVIHYIFYIITTYHVFGLIYIFRSYHLMYLGCCLFFF